MQNVAKEFSALANSSVSNPVHLLYHLQAREAKLYTKLGGKMVKAGKA